MSGPACNQPAPPTLDYGQRSRFGWISRHRRLLIFLALLIAFAGPVWWYWQPIKQRVIWIYRFRQAAAHHMPGPIELLVTDPVKARQLLATDPDYMAGDTTGTTAIYIPAALRLLRDVDPRFSFPYRTVRSIPVDSSQAVVFLGTLRRPDGLRRFVVIQGATDYSSTLFGNVILRVYPIPGLTAPFPSPPTTPMFHRYPAVNNNAAELRAAVTDPNDPSHLVIEFVVGREGIRLPTFGGGIGTLRKHVEPDQIAQHGLIDAWLQNDDSMRFTFRPGPTSESPVVGTNAGTILLNVDATPKNVIDSRSLRSSSVTQPGLRRGG